MRKQIEKICIRMLEKGIISKNEMEDILQDKHIQLIIIILARIGIL